jgi:ComF family protein
MFRYLLNFVYPPRCASCDIQMPIDMVRRVCDTCMASIEPIYPPFCVICAAPLNSEDLENRCGHCRTALPAFDSVRSIARYRSGASPASAIASMLRRHKYGLDQSLGRALAEYLDMADGLDAGAYDVIMPVPLHRTRLRWRGFNQAALLGAALSRRLSCPLDVTSLARIRPTQPQTARDRTERARNVRRAFAVQRPARVAGRCILLVDDVMTTGATADECARVLRDAGARRIDVFTLARVV